MSQTHNICRLTFRSAKKYAALRMAWPTKYLNCLKWIAVVVMVGTHVRAVAYASASAQVCECEMYVSI